MCFHQSRTNLADSYGALAYPIPPLDRLRELVATTILEPNSIDLISDVMFEITSRADVNQGPLVKVRMFIDHHSAIIEQALPNIFPSLLPIFI